MKGEHIIFLKLGENNYLPVPCDNPILYMNMMYKEFHLDRVQENPLFFNKPKYNHQKVKRIIIPLRRMKFYAYEDAKRLAEKVIDSGFEEKIRIILEER